MKKLILELGYNVETTVVIIVDGTKRKSLIKK